MKDGFCFVVSHLSYLCKTIGRETLLKETTYTEISLVFPDVRVLILRGSKTEFFNSWFLDSVNLYVLWGSITYVGFTRVLSETPASDECRSRDTGGLGVQFCGFHRVAPVWNWTWVPLCVRVALYTRIHDLFGKGGLFPVLQPLPLTYIGLRTPWARTHPLVRITTVWGRCPTSIDRPSPTSSPGRGLPSTGLEDLEFDTLGAT